MLMRQMTTQVVIGTKEMGFSWTYTKSYYLVGCLKVPQVAPRGLNVAPQIFACV